MIIADTGYWLALANRADDHHEAAVQALHHLREPLITTWPVVTETCHLLLDRLGNKAQLSFIAGLRRRACRLFALTEQHLPRVEALMGDYADLPMDLVDASLVVLAEEIGTGRIFSTDRRDFRAYRWKNHRPFKNLLLEG